MSEINDGGPAFPADPQWLSPKNIDQSERMASGMSLRDYFAAKLMPAIWTMRNPLNDHDCALMAYRMADAMLRAREA